MEWYWPEEIKVYGDKPAQHTSVQRRSHMDWGGIEPEPMRWEMGY